MLCNVIVKRIHSTAVRNPIKENSAFVSSLPPIKAIPAQRAKGQTQSESGLHTLHLHCLRRVAHPSRTSKALFAHPSRVQLNCCCAHTGKRVKRLCICLSFIRVAKRLLIPRCGDDFPNKSLPKHMPCSAHPPALMEKHNGKITQMHNARHRQREPPVCRGRIRQ